MMCYRTFNNGNNINHNSAYFSEDKFKMKFSLNHNAFSLIHFNARSLPQNFDKIVDYLDLLKFPFSVIGITETWITNDCDLSFYNIENYKFLSCCRNDRQGGGVGSYLKDNINFNRLTDLEINDDEVCQSIFVEIKFDKSTTIIGAIYRPPNGDIEKFNDYGENTLGGSNKSIHIMGDFNINLLNIEFCNFTSAFLEVMLSHSLCPSIFRPTRITTYSATLIDNTFSYTQPFSTGILLTDISDHLPVFSIMDVIIPKSRPPSYIFKRNNTKENVNRFLESLRSSDWSSVFSTTDPNTIICSMII